MATVSPTLSIQFQAPLSASPTPNVGRGAQKQCLVVEVAAVAVVSGSASAQHAAAGGCRTYVDV